MKIQILNNLLMILSKLEILSKTIYLIIFNIFRFIMLKEYSIERK